MNAADSGLKEPVTSFVHLGVWYSRVLRCIRPRAGIVIPTIWAYSRSECDAFNCDGTRRKPCFTRYRQSVFHVRFGAN